MSRRRRIILIVVAVDILIVAGVVAVFVLRGSNEPAPVALPSPEPAAAARPAGGELEAAEGSFVGYRVRETFASIGAATAVGRTGEVTGSVRVMLRSQRSGDGVDLAGSTRIRFRDFGMQPPSVAGVVSVRDEGLMEVRLLLR